MPPIVPTPPVGGKPEWEVPPECVPDLEKLVTEDGAPGDRIFTEKQYRLLTTPLYASWSGPGEGRSFLVLTNVGWFFDYNEPPLVPDCLLGLDIACPENLHVKEGHSYFQWLMRGKPPEAVIEIVSDRRGDEDSLKMREYARLRASYYAIFDPDNVLRGGILRVFELHRGKYRPLKSGYMEEVGLGLTLWEGPFEGHSDTWLRWCDRNKKVLPTSDERAQKAERVARGDRRKRKDAERHAEQSAQRIRELEEALRRLQAGDGKK
jgi:Uma2 family endonuclease